MNFLINSMSMEMVLFHIKTFANGLVVKSIQEKLCTSDKTSHLTLRSMLVKKTIVGKLLSLTHIIVLYIKECIKIEYSQCLTKLIRKLVHNGKNSLRPLKVKLPLMSLI